MTAEPRQLRVVFLPFMASGHTIPMLDIVRLFAARDCIKSTVITTPVNAPNISSSLENCVTGATSTIDVHIIPFPAREAGLPEGIENLDQVTSQDMYSKFIFSAQLLRDPVERFLEDIRPDCLIADFFFPFATDIAAKLGIPRLDFHGTGFFPKCAMGILRQYEPQKTVLSDDEPFILPKLPHQVKLTKSQVERRGIDNSGITQFIGVAMEAGMRCYGEIFNSFYDLEPDYVDYYRNVLKKKCWHIGPVSLSNRRMDEKFFRGKNSALNEHECLEWLDSKEPESVIYICFGSTTKFSGPQLKEIALALESSGQQFIWVLQKDKGDEEWLRDGFEERMHNKGLIVRGWAPQVVILGHKAVGGFVTHCGWNSTLEGISAGLPMVTWPVFAEQFLNEKLITDILKIGVQVGSKQWNVMSEGTFLKSGEIGAALKRVMKGSDALEMRNRAKKLKDFAREAVDEGGSSYCNLSSLIQELGSRQP
ncbi:hypothetical protein RND81_07G170800 [Saponaria officinalis]|uniref:Glycosyltransferase n=1 Tax=Saponaria officinalis TaxID=3572 RepID=A0AAW1JST6_SAPOF